jgi:two-component system cell cycle response regulator
MARKHRTVDPTGRRVLLADDDQDYLEATRLLLESEGHTVLCAESGPRALRMLREQSADLLLLDYFMPGMTGEEVVTRLREFDPYIQVVLQTGYSDEQPPREMLRKLDIQGYYDKSEGPEKLLLWTDAGLKAAQVLQRVQRSREGLRYVLESSPTFHKVQPVGDLLEGILRHAVALVRILAPPREGSGASPSEAEPTGGFLAMLSEDAELRIRTACGRFQPGQPPEAALDASQTSELLESLRTGEIHLTDSATVLPLRIGELTLGVMYVEATAAGDQVLELLRLFASQAAVAVQSMQLYEVAALDPLTGVHARRFFEQWLRREVRTAFRSQKPLSMLLLDIDGMRSINDTAGHLVGDQALVTAGHALRGAVRDNDVVARYGGDEFVVLLPETPAQRAEKVAWRVIAALNSQVVDAAEGADLALRCSLGLTELGSHSFDTKNLRRTVPATYFQQVAQTVVKEASAALEHAKSQGGGHLHAGSTLTWPELAEEDEV